MASVYDIVTEKFIQAMEKTNIAPWQKTWEHDQWPKNLISKKEYTGVNVWLLQIMNQPSPFWATYKQVTNLGGLIKEEEHKNYAIIVFYQSQQKNEDNEEAQRAVLRYYRVWNVAQTTLEIPQQEKKMVNPIVLCADIVSGYKDRPMITVGSPAYYPTLDKLTCPTIGAFRTPEYYYGTLFHELIHSTGHKNRLDRFTQKTVFGSETYSFEELIAEIGASFLCSMTNINLPEVTTNQEAYVKAWISKLQNDKTMIVKASSAAKKTVEYMENRR